MIMWENILFAAAFTLAVGSPLAMVFMWLEMNNLKWWRDFYKREAGHYNALYFQKEPVGGESSQ